jgi:hypothetical protein
MKSAKTWKEYYLTRQIFVFSSETYTTIIFTGLPNEKLSWGPYVQPLKEWWEALRLTKPRN